MKSFFEEMERNVMRNIDRGDATGKVIDEETRRRRESDSSANSNSNGNGNGNTGNGNNNEPSDLSVFPLPVFSKAHLETVQTVPPSRVVRTISSMDDLLLAELTKTEASNRKAKEGRRRSLDDGASERDVRAHAMQAGDLR